MLFPPFLLPGARANQRVSHSAISFCRFESVGDYWSKVRRETRQIRLLKAMASCREHSHVSHHTLKQCLPLPRLVSSPVVVKAVLVTPSPLHSKTMATTSSQQLATPPKSHNRCTTTPTSPSSLSKSRILPRSSLQQKSFGNKRMDRWTY